MFSSRSSRLARGGLVAALACAITAGVAPTRTYAAGTDNLVYFPTFAGASTMLDRNGSADIITSSGRVHQRILRLTAGGFRQAGSAWAKPKLNLTGSFESQFKVYLHHTTPGADGIAFLVQNDGPRALGGWGGGIGYRGIRDSVAVEFDTFQNSTDPSSNHLAVVLHGNPDVHAAVGEPSIPLYGRPFWARVTYDAPTHDLRVYVQSLRAGAEEELALETKVDLAAGVGASSAWVGFTAGTGNLYSKQDIYSWMVQTPGA
ncbi:L-type lectin-domain containing protein [Actinoplanes subtropicus]|uniref:L-type lectin-domain containing protein n=1 Tax=Actinoplanes subtropicus TaxID=543632 RepID=UPI000AD96CAB|nr:L-type lectin-domain containing protein [Actinoplanes subtropicus]